MTHVMIPILKYISIEVSVQSNKKINNLNFATD